MSLVRRPTSALLGLAVVSIACSSETDLNPGDTENVEVQVGNYAFYQEFWGNNALAPAASLTGPANVANFTFTYTGDPLQNPGNEKVGWHKYKFALNTDDVVTLRVVSPGGGGVLFERSCTVHPRALTLTYAEFLTYGAEFKEDDDGTILPPGPDAQCGCGFREYGDQRNANQCS